MAWVVWKPPGWALPCESELGWHRQVRWHFGREKSTGRDGKTGKHSLCLEHQEQSSQFAESGQFVQNHKDRMASKTEHAILCRLYLEESGQWLKAFEMQMVG